jgi:hypothetical protein
MKKLKFTILFLTVIFAVQAQAKKTDILQSFESEKSLNQNVTTTATLKASSRLFKTKDDLTSVILIIPSGSTVTVLGQDSTYLHVTFEENEGFIFSRHAVIDKTAAAIVQTVQPQQAIPQDQSNQEQQVSRFTYLESKYGTTMATRINAGKIWKGMNSEMVKDSWGNALKINREVTGNTIKEEWIYRNTWLYFENNMLIDWGPVKK